MNPVTKALLALVALAAAVGLYTAVTWSPPDDGVGPRLRFAEGVALRYDLEHRSRQRVAVPELAGGGQAPQMTADARIEGQLVLRGLAPADGVQRFALRFEALTAADIRVQGQSLLDGASLVGPEAVVSMATDGEIVGVQLPADAPQALHVAVHLVLSEAQVRLGDGGTWQASETTAHGEARARYRRAADGFDRVRDDYALQAVRIAADQTTDSRARFAVEQGRIVRLTADEAISARAAGGGPLLLDAESHTALVLIAVETAADRPTPRLGVATRLGAPATVGDPRAQALRERIGDLDAAQARAMIEQAVGGRLPEHNRTLWRLTALLRTDAALCAWLGAFAGAPGRTRVARALALDLLTSAGTAEAQAALRGALDSEATRATDGYAVLYQRAGLLTRPDGQTLDWLATRHRAPGPEGQTAATLALGAAAGAAARGPDLGEAGRALAAGLLDEALAADDPTTRAVRLRALGNAARPEHAAAIAGFAADADPAVRHATAAALRRIEGPAARATLVDLAVDGDARVQGRALTSLGDRHLSAAELQRLAGAVADGTLAESSLDRVVDRLLVQPDPAARAVIDAILARDLRDSRIKGRIRSLLGG